jgi:predicted ribosome quality control (RQC) complex YloA/Tae2 family protein
VLRPLISNSRSRLLRNLDARVGRAIKAKERRLDGLLNQLQNSVSAELFRRKGELLLANLTSVPPRAETVTLSEWRGDEAEESAPLEIALDPKLSPSRNAERYFKKYRKAHGDPQKLQEEIVSLRSAIEEIREQRDLLDSIEDPGKFEEAVGDVVDWLTPQAETKQPMRKTSSKTKDKALPPHLRFEVDDCTILVGLSARGNRFVTFKLASGDDLWLHVHEVPGAHVIVKSSKKREELEDGKTLAFAASLAAAYSRERSSLSVQVDYTERRHVRSVPGANIALVTYTHPGTIRVSPGYWKETRVP